MDQPSREKQGGEAAAPIAQSSEMATAPTVDAAASSTPAPEPSTAAFLIPVAPGLREKLGRYENLGEMNRGGMGVIYRARDPVLGRTVALKMIKGAGPVNPKEFERFLREARAVARLKHDNIVKIHDFGQLEGQPYFTMELAEQGSLFDHLERFKMDPRASVNLLAKVARAVHYYHERKIVHGDLKPGNILLEANDKPVVSDFGLAKAQEAESDMSVGQVRGTPAYMAPEQAAGRTAEIGPPTDVWALGVILFELLTGQRPPRDAGETSSGHLLHAAMCKRHLHQNLQAAISKCLESNPGGRYSSANALADDLESALILGLFDEHEFQVSPEPGGSPQVASGRSAQHGIRAAVPILEPRKRRSRLPLLLVLTLLALALVVSLVVSRLSRPNKHEDSAATFRDLEELRRPAPLSEARWSLNAAGTDLEVSASDFVMLALGSCDADFDLDVTFTETVAGRISAVGLFFGYNEETIKDAPLVRFQTIVCKRMNPGLDNEIVALERAAGEDRGYRIQKLMASKPLDGALNSDNELGISVTNGKVISVRWNGAQIVLDVPPGIASLGPATGKFGVWCEGASAVFRRYSFREKK